MKIAEGIKYSKDHEWVKLEGDVAYVGITDFAQDHLGDIVYVELPHIDDEFGAGDAFSAVDSVKAASDIYTPITGKVVKVNDALSDDPEMVNRDPYDAWIAAFEITNASEIDALMDAEQYKALCEAEADNA